MGENRETEGLTRAAYGGYVGMRGVLLGVDVGVPCGVRRVPTRGGVKSMNSSSIFLILGAVAVVLALLLLAPASPEPTTTPIAVQTTPSGLVGAETIPRPVGTPMVDAGPDRTVRERETIELNGTVNVPGGTVVATTWTAEGGLGFFQNAHSPTTSYTAPSACDCEDKVVLTLTAVGASGVLASDTMILSVRDPLACPVETYEAGGSFVTVIDPCYDTGNLATCPAQPSEPCTSPCITDVPPSGGCSEIPVPCPCSIDGCEDGGIAGWAGGWPFGPQPEHPRDRPKPRIDRHFAASIREKGSTPIWGTISNPACVPVCFTWSVSKGWLEGADTLEPVYHAPESDRRDGEMVTITLTCYDSSGGRSYDQIRFQIVNTDPT